MVHVCNYSARPGLRASALSGRSNRTGQIVLSSSWICSDTCEKSMFYTLEHKFDTLEHKFETLEHKFQTLEHRF